MTSQQVQIRRPLPERMDGSLKNLTLDHVSNVRGKKQRFELFNIHALTPSAL
jgi:hypothetical protein